MPDNVIYIIVIAVAIVLIFATIALWASRYKKCPADKIMVIYGKVGKDKDGNIISARCIHGGAAFIMPVVQAYAFLDLNIMRGEVNVRDGDKCVSGNFAVAISTEQGVMQNAAERLLNLPREEILELAKDILMGQIRMLFEDGAEKKDFFELLARNTETELRKIGMWVVSFNFNITV